MTVNIDVVNEWGYEEFIARLGGAVEHFPTLVAGLWSHRPFTSLQHLHTDLCALIDQLPFEIKQGIVRVHPDLAGRLANEGALTKESTNEQKSAGLLSLTPDEKAYLATHNKAYKLKFGFPFVICARQNKKESILTGIRARYLRGETEETLKAVDEVKKIALFRLQDVIEIEEQDLKKSLSKI